MKLKEALLHPERALFAYGVRGGLRFLDDVTYLRVMYWWKFGKRLNLDTPRTFSEKLQWLKLNNRVAERTKMVDKYEAKQYVADRIGEEYIIPTLGVWDRFEDIDFDMLPDQFVLKCTHDSGGLVICKDKTSLDKEAARQKINRSLKRNYYYCGREWPYKNVKPRIIAEQFMEDYAPDGTANSQLTDYKFFCFDGYVDCVMVCFDRDTEDTKFYFFDADWNLLRLNARGKSAPADFTLPKPACMDAMFALASELSKGSPYARVDLYACNDRIYFGELTFYPQTGMDSNLLPEAEERWGDLIKLPVLEG